MDAVQMMIADLAFSAIFYHVHLFFIILSYCFNSSHLLFSFSTIFIIFYRLKCKGLSTAARWFHCLGQILPAVIAVG